MIKLNQYALFGIVFFVALIITAPAVLLAKWVENTTNGQLILANASGSVWQGNATLSIRQRSGNLLTSDKLHWNISILSILIGKMVVSIRFDNSTQIQPMVLTASYGQIELRNAHIPIHTGVLGELVPILQPLQLSGDMILSSDLFIISKRGISGNASVDCLNVGSVVSNVNPLGSYRFNLVGAGERLDASLSTMSGILLLEGKGSFIQKHALSFQMTAHASEEKKESLSELLNYFGPGNAQGVHTINIGNPRI